MRSSAQPSGFLFASVGAPPLGVGATVALALTSVAAPLWLLGIVAAPLAALAYGGARNLPRRRLAGLAAVATAVTVAVLAAIVFAILFFFYLTFDGFELMD